MLELRLVQGNLLLEALRSAGGLGGTHATFTFSGAGLNIHAMEATRTALVEIHLRSTGLHHYRCDRHTFMGINLTILNDMLKDARDDDTIIIKAQHNSETLTFMFVSANGDKTVDFDMKREECLGLEVPELDHAATIKMPYREFDWIFQYLRRINDSDKQVTISVTSEGVKFSSQTRQGTAANIFCKQSPAAVESEDATMIEVTYPVSSTYKPELLYYISTAYRWSNTVTIRLNSDLPLEVDYKIAEIGYIRFHLAPVYDAKVQDEDVFDDDDDGDDGDNNDDDNDDDDMW